MNHLLNLLLYIPGAIELTLFLLIYIGLSLLRRTELVKNIARAVFGTGSVMTLIAIVLSFTDVFRPHYIFVHLLVAFLGFLGLRVRPKIQWVTLPLGAVIYALGFLFFTFVEVPLVLQATWAIHEPGAAASGWPAELRVQFNYGEKKNFQSTVYSDELAKHLREKQSPTADLTLGLLYHWGTLAGTSLDAVDGERFAGTEAGAGCENECAPSPFPKYFLGPRTHFLRR